MERTGGFRISALVVAAATMLLLGAGEAFAGAASDVNADTVGCFDQAIGGSPGAIWYLTDSTGAGNVGPSQWTEFGSRGSDTSSAVGKFGGANVTGLGSATFSGGIANFFGLTDPTNDQGAATFFGSLPIEASVSGTTAPVALAGNWTGNGNPGWGLYYPDVGAFVLDSDPGNPTMIPPFLFGPVDAANVVPVVGDFDGDGNDTVGVYHRGNGYFYLTDNVVQTPNTGVDEINGAKTVFAFGPTGDNWIPVVGDWDLQGGDSVGLYDPDTGTFYLANENNDADSGGDGKADVIMTLGDGGASTDCQPVAGNWNIGPAN